MAVTSATDGQILRQSSSYRQGLVLGLTMAEIMVLLVFCLLIALATFLKAEQDKRAAADARADTEHAERVKAEKLLEAAANGGDHDLMEAIRQNPQIAEQVKAWAKSGGAKEVDENWRELVKARKMVVAATAQGLSEKEIDQALAEAATLKAKGADGQVAQNAETVKKIQATMSAAGETATTPDDMVKMVERGLHPWPPIIKLSEAGGYFFQTGSAALTTEFRDKLKDSIPGQIIEIINKYGVDVVEVVGHTDEQPVGSRPSNLDSDLIPVLKDNAAVTGLVPADNAGLGLARAASVVSVLLQNPKLAGYKLLPLSGAQLINVDESLALSGTPRDIRERRRIEIRLRKSAPQQELVPKASPPPARAPKMPRRAKPNPILSGAPANGKEPLSTIREH